MYVVRSEAHPTKYGNDGFPSFNPSYSTVIT